MKYYLFLDDSGVLEKNCSQGSIFNYGGLLIQEKNYHSINKAYKNYIKKLKKEKDISSEEEYKTANMSFNTRRRAIKVLKNYDAHQIFVCAKIKSLKRLDFKNSKKVVRYKNYMIFRLIEKLINENLLPNDCTEIIVNIDNQNVANAAEDSLEDYLNNRFNEDSYYYVHLNNSNNTYFECDFKVNYKDSKYDYLIQAADLLANAKHNSFNFDKINNCSLRYTRKFFKNNYVSLRLPDDVNYR